jgi:hypothetical protein
VPCDGAEDCAGADDCAGAEDCAGADDCAGAEDCTGADDCAGAEATDELAAEDAVLAGVVFGLAFGFLAGACSAGIALAPASAVIVACCAEDVAGAARDAEGAGAELFLIADPMAKAPPSPITSATASSSQRLRTS